MSRYTIEHGRHKRRNFLQHLIPVFALLSIAGGGYHLYSQPGSTQSLDQPVSALSSVQQEQLKLTAALPWPAYGQSAYGTVENGVMASSKEQAPAVPIASLAKVITALAVLKEKPLKQGEQGPMITLTEADIEIYNDYVRGNGTVVPVQAGEQISQYQALQAMLQPSANNIADALAKWAFGSIENYNAYANKMVKEYGIVNTTVSDASGYSWQTISTANDMVRIGGIYMQNPVLKEIAMQPGATIPFAGPIPNYNTARNKDGIVGIKIGNTDEAGRCFLVADIRNGKVISIAATLGAETMTMAMDDAVKVLNAGNSEYDHLTANRP